MKKSIKDKIDLAKILAQDIYGSLFNENYLNTNEEDLETIDQDFKD